MRLNGENLAGFVLREGGIGFHQVLYSLDDGTLLFDGVRTTSFGSGYKLKKRRRRRQRRGEGGTRTGITIIKDEIL